jgi:biopolymer transport protein ExbD/biopolymer transport protein TolR
VRRRRAGRLHLNAEINVVSLIDVMMLLLVIFMITAPLMQGGVDVKLPVADARPLESKSAMVITITRAGVIFVDRNRVTYGEFASSFKALVGTRASQGVTVQADKDANWEAVARVLAVVRNSGVTNVGIVTEPEARPR